MSLARTMLRLTALEALRGRTLVGDNVTDSLIGAIDVGADGTLQTDAEKPFLTIRTDDSETADAPLRDLHQNGVLDFVLEFGVTAAMKVTHPDTGEPLVDPETGQQLLLPGVPNTDAAFEFFLDAVDRQIVNALTDPANSWSELWRKLHDKVTKIERRRAASDDNGVRLAARQLRISLATKSDPVLSEPLVDTSIWSRCRVALATARPDLTDTLDALFGVEGAEVTYAMIQRSRGHTAAEASALGYVQYYDAPIATAGATEIEDDGGVGSP